MESVLGVEGVVGNGKDRVWDVPHVAVGVTGGGVEVVGGKSAAA